ncbi:TetR/AcrR family transcriptional regulator [Bacillus cihuensis]|uniref:TetR/AcrR family transcriptional regulator n=1 Tax=Bacillus cihuensis TaxID=1208599 RepID=UPI000402773A|nr:TetR/AcrR family transcriptional regulator [Bacillus cihuensis]
MSAELIRNVALIQFARDGYEGASLSKIAEEVGIKKPSIYAHYKGKDELFFAVVNYAMETEKKRFIEYFQSQESKPIKEVLRGFFDWIETESMEHDHARFLLRISFFPPSKLQQDVADLVNPFLLQMQRILARWLRNRQANLYTSNVMDSALAYITLVDGTVLELIYSGSMHYQNRIRAAWPIFWRGFHIPEEGVKKNEY